MSLPQFLSEKPKFTERGVTLSASTVKYSEKWMYALLDSMAILKMNTLLWEVKIAQTEAESIGINETSAGSAEKETASLPVETEKTKAEKTESFPITSQPFITPAEAKQIISYARERGIEIIAEINAPGHLRTWLKHYPQYAIKLSTGELDLERLDLTNPEAIQWYLRLVDTYLEIFESQWWHMGADEFENELDHRTYADYPQLSELARARWGEEAKPWDVNTDFVNQVNAHLKSRGKRLRIWNDGMRRGGVINLDSDILVEYWIDRGAHTYSPQEIAALGHELLNVPQYLYFSRSEKHIYDPQPAQIYEGKRATLELFDGDQNGPQARGVRLSLWPDRDWMQTPGEVFREARDTLILVGQIAWDGAQVQKTWSKWEDFKAYADTLDLPIAPEY